MNTQGLQLFMEGTQKLPPELLSSEDSRLPERNHRNHQRDDSGNRLNPIRQRNFCRHRSILQRHALAAPVQCRANVDTAPLFASAGFAMADMREAQARGEALKLLEDEVAFYDALESNDSAVKVLGDETLRTIAQELVRTVRANVTIDWTLRENVRAQLRVLVKRILRKYGYPPGKQEKATETVLEQAALLSAEWAV